MHDLSISINFNFVKKAFLTLAISRQRLFKCISLGRCLSVPIVIQFALTDSILLHPLFFNIQ